MLGMFLNFRYFEPVVISSRKTAVPYIHKFRDPPDLMRVYIALWFCTLDIDIDVIWLVVSFMRRGEKYRRFAAS
jgi:hypothetical protein